MRQTLIDIVGLVGFSALSYGIYLKYGLSIALMVCGGLALVFAILASRGPK